ncbi:unnamed protein product [Cylicocyclus nassatus]|uniref:Uncharacterized protein n=1 Tax=Cylicocyclus nassatus TaxID=53992 RepID=A0AA36MB98_CYLNA|nr:unnamed protein product [Cylicocyclus nassatus]
MGLKAVWKILHNSSSEISHSPTTVPLIFHVERIIIPRVFLSSDLFTNPWTSTCNIRKFGFVVWGTMYRISTSHNLIHSLLLFKLESCNNCLAMDYVTTQCARPLSDIALSIPHMAY